MFMFVRVRLCGSMGEVCLGNMKYEDLQALGSIPNSATKQNTKTMYKKQARNQKNSTCVLLVEWVFIWEMKTLVHQLWSQGC